MAFADPRRSELAAAVSGAAPELSSASCYHVQEQSPTWSRYCMLEFLEHPRMKTAASRSVKGGKGGDDAACDFTFVVGFARRARRGLVDAGSDNLQRERRGGDKLAESVGSNGADEDDVVLRTGQAQCVEGGGRQTWRPICRCNQPET
ncbi:hypothetical protein B0H13DRAFT_1911284 [Mycena leptocephala]|nr:hypothetical protein B0H13DRAFT_1911284 [Mycena leptocephala]